MKLTHETEKRPIRGNVKRKVRKAIYNGCFKKYRGRECTVHHVLNGSARITIDGHDFSLYVLETRLKDIQA